MSESLTPEQLATMRSGASPEMDVALDEIEWLGVLLDEWQRVGDFIMLVVTGKAGPLSDSEVIGEFERLRSERDEAREAARWLWKRHVMRTDEIGYLKRLTWLGEGE